MSGIIFRFFPILAAVIAFAPGVTANTLWVSGEYSADGFNDGHTWGVDAFNTINNAIDAAESGTTVYVSAGRYIGIIGLKSGVAVIGAGPETTILDADHSGCAVGAWSVRGCRIEGFTITNGADVVTDTQWIFGSGMVAMAANDLLIRNCHFVNNTAGLQRGGGGIYMNSSSGVIENCLFVNNAAVVNPWSGIADGSGGAIHAERTNNLVIRNCAFVSNSAVDAAGAVLGGSLIVENCTFLNNSAESYCGAVKCTNTGVFTGCTFAGNTGGTWGPVNASLLKLNNCIIWGNEVNYVNGYIRNCNIQGLSSYGWSASVIDLGGNLDMNPLFADLDGHDDIPGTIDDDVRLRWDSPCVDAGANVSVSSAAAADLDGRVRIWDGDCDGVSVVDMGAYEYKPVAADTTDDCSVDFSDFCMMSEHWLETGCNPCGGADLDGDAKVTLSDLSVLACGWLLEV